MRFLLDINVLVALCLAGHVFHERVAVWTKRSATAEAAVFLTCAVTEIGFLRVLVQAPAYSYSIEQGVQLLSQLRKSEVYRFEFLGDALGIAKLPRWVKGPKQITDGHLVELAKSSGAILATLDNNIPTALLLPSGRITT